MIKTLVGGAPANRSLTVSARIRVRSLVADEAQRPGDVYGFLVMHLVLQAIRGN
jgi:hypothetical protein